LNFYLLSYQFILKQQITALLPLVKNKSQFPLIKKTHNMNYSALSILLLLLTMPLSAQVTYTANDQVATYDETFRVGVNPGYNGPDWSDENLAVLSAGSPPLNVPGVGMMNFRASLPEYFLDQWGYDIRINAFEYYVSLGMDKHTVFLQGPTNEHRSQESFCDDSQSELWANMYLPIWDGGANGTPVNDDNYAALYIYRTVSEYKDFVKFWEIMNEPDFDYSGNGWKDADMEGNWWNNVPEPCDYKLQAPVYHYIRLLRISYEVIKSVDPDAFVGIGGLGYESFLDIILRHTDNPDGGLVSTDYPLTGGAYFDAMVYHCYPHINGSMRYWSNDAGGFIYTRHSDAGADGVIALKDSFEDLLFDYGYNGDTYPKKPFILTETNIPRIPFDEYIGSDEAQRNFAIKVQVEAIKNDIRQLHFFELAEKEKPDEANSWVQTSGLYEKISDDIPYDVTRTQAGIACQTTTHFLWEKEYDAIATEALNLPNDVRGAAFKTTSGEYVYVLWAATEIDMSEVAATSFTFPISLNFESVQIHAWDYQLTNEVINSTPINIELTGSPVFITGSSSPLNPIEEYNLVNWRIYPNPVDNICYFEFENLTPQKGEILLQDAAGREVYRTDALSFDTGVQQIKIPVADLVKGVYFGNLKFKNGKSQVFRFVR